MKGHADPPKSQNSPYNHHCVEATRQQTSHLSELALREVQLVEMRLDGFDEGFGWLRAVYLGKRRNPWSRKLPNVGRPGGPVEGAQQRKAQIQIVHFCSRAPSPPTSGMNGDDDSGHR